VGGIGGCWDATIKRMCAKSGDDMTKEEKQKLKAFFTAQFFHDADVYGPDYSTLTSGDIEGFSLEAIGKVIDKFDETKIN